MKVELPRENKSLADINAGECFAVIRGQITSVCMKVAWLIRATFTAMAINFRAKGNLLSSHSLYQRGGSRVPLNVVFCSNLVPIAPHRFRFSHLPGSFLRKISASKEPLSSQAAVGSGSTT
jgi:hypothetical protein